MMQQMHRQAGLHLQELQINAQTRTGKPGAINAPKSDVDCTAHAGCHRHCCKVNPVHEHAVCGSYFPPVKHQDRYITNQNLCSVHKGWNCIDTASNYRSGRGELAVGYALRSLFTANVGISRDMLFIR